MRFLTVKRGLAAFAALVALAILLLAALPWIASTQIVRDRIAYELGLWSGYRVSLGAAPVLDVWPGFRATLEDVAFHEWADGGRPPVLEAERLEVSLSPLAALRGNVVLSGMSMHRPLLRLSTSGSVLDLPASPGGGRMMRAVETARKVVADNPASPDAGALPDIAFGTVEFFDGRIVDAEGDVVTSLRGRVVWPSLNRGARLVATGIWRGENVAVEASAASPLILIAGGSTAVSASLKSALVEAGFEGTANLSGDAYFDGPAKISSPSIRRMLEWSRTRIAPGAAIGAMSVASRVQGNARRLQLDQTTLTLGGNTGRGVLDLSFADAVPAISGTLAFDKLDLRSFLMAFTPAASGAGSIHDRIDTAFSDQLSLDLRLSSAAATFGAVALTDVAASTQVKGNLAAFDISDATAFGGEVQAGLRIDGAGGEKTVEMRLMASNVDALALAKAAGAERLLPQGRASVSVMLKGTGDDWDEAMARAEGSVTASLGQGALSGFDLARFRALWADGGFFPLSEVAGGTLPLRGFDFKARVSGGVARIEKADVQLEQQMTVSVAGIVHYVGQALALSGYFAPVAQDGTRAPAQMPFFVGGSWNAPFVSPAAADYSYD
ncbi:MAG: AsmA family protein [Hyphomicrobiales bacterium]|nr:MAG: AsmA family protein [Hyphomicrobiales bacterium]